MSIFSPHNLTSRPLGTEPGSPLFADPSAPGDGVQTDSSVRSPTSTRSEVRSPTSTRTEVRSPTSTHAYTSGNFTSTVTGGAGAGATYVTIHIPGPPPSIDTDPATPDPAIPGAIFAPVPGAAASGLGALTTANEVLVAGIAVGVLAGVIYYHSKKKRRRN